MSTSIYALRLGSISSAANCLSLNTRPAHPFFDDDGPGLLSASGPRHDNDFADIRDIQILPTTDEILAVDRPQYMPRKNLAERHFLESSGPRRLLDTLFRHLRYDNTESIRDICYNAAQVLASNNSLPGRDYEIQHETASKVPYYLYRDVQIEELFAHERKGLLVRASYACPSFMHGRKIHRSGRFKEGMLCALIGLDDNGALTTNFCDIHMSQSTDSMKNRRNGAIHAAVQLSFLNSTHHDEILHLTRCAHDLTSTRFVLVEFPNTLYAGFYWCLRRLQMMQSNDLAFKNYLAPHLDPASIANNVQATAAGSRNLMSILPPAYAQDAKFLFDVSCISKAEAKFTLEDLCGQSKTTFLQHLEQNTSLDEGQANALCENLTREFAFTQGPPGTGKTYLGISLARVILASRKAQKPKPILAVCQTNHALDSFLGGLRDSGTTNLVRIGSASKEPWTEDINLRKLSKKTRLTEREWDGTTLASRNCQSSFAELDSWCKGFNAQRTSGILSWCSVKAVLQDSHADIYEQLVTATTTPHAEAFTFDYWANGGDLKNLRDLHVELRSRLSGELGEANGSVDEAVNAIVADISRRVQERHRQAGDNNVWNIALEDRNRLLDGWKSEIDQEWLAGQFAAMHVQHQQAWGDMQSKCELKKAKTILQCDVVGMTTTACAQNWDLLKSLDLEVVICEEAGEVIEAHTLCTLFPSIQHAIFIGDPLQLRPQVAVQSLSLDTELGSQYRLDESLFERVMIPSDPSASGVLTSRLLIQRRMHPNIADISRLTYPYLRDHESTEQHPATIGLAQRMFWLDHRSPESASSNNKSYFNAHEVTMVTGLVQYLLKESAYSLGEIAVLTPYNGQLAALHDSLSTNCPVWLSEKDRETLNKDGLFEEGHRPVTRAEVKMSDMLRIATVDNFQGEEAKIIIITTVRSCGRPGFMKTINRINVACSRARNGFYIVGNSETLRKVPMWNAVINVFASNGQLGTTLRTCCSRHPTHYLDVVSPQDFKKIQDCTIMCGENLKCGHQCEQTCHASDLHEKVPCTKACAKVLSCGHACTKLCFEDCGKCAYPMGEKLLPCGHSVGVSCEGKVPRCQALVAEVELPCGHKFSPQCSDTGKPKVCHEKCDMPLMCGHLCQGLCLNCISNTSHPTCSSSCNKKLECGHACESTCHGDSPCPPCANPCEKGCCHGACKSLCSKPCDPCVQLHKSTCSHQPESKMLCCLPSDTLPCSNACKNVLPCGHTCPSVCSEPCPDPACCPACKSEDPVSQTQIFLPACRHLVDLKTLDKLVLNDVYQMDQSGGVVAIKSEEGTSLVRPTCPCGAPISGVRRYEVVDSLLDLSETIDRLNVKFGQHFQQQEENLAAHEAELAQGFDAFSLTIRPNPLSAMMNKSLVFARGSGLIRQRNKIRRFKEEVITRFQESMAKLRQAFPGRVSPVRFDFDLHFSLLEYRARSIWLEDILKVADHLAQLVDPSNEIQRLAEVLRSNAGTECRATLKRCKYSISRSLAIEIPAAATSDMSASDLQAKLRLQERTLQRLANIAAPPLSNSNNSQNKGGRTSDGENKTSPQEDAFKAGQKFLHEDAFLLAMRKTTIATQVSMPANNIGTYRG